MLGHKVASEREMPTASGTRPEAGTPPDVAAAQRKLRAMQWAVPGLTGALVVISAFAGEQQRLNEANKGVLKRLAP